MGKNKFVFVLPSLGAGGGNRVMINLVNELALKGMQVTLLVYSDEKESRYPIAENVLLKQWKDINKNKFSRIFNLISLMKYIKHECKDAIIVISDQFSAILSFIIRRQCVYRYVQADDYNFYDDLQILRYRFILRMYKITVKRSFHYRFLHNIYASEFIYDQCVANKVIPKGEYKKLNPSIRRDTFYNMHIRKAEECNLCIVARNHPTKGFSDFVNAFPLLRLREKVSHVYILSPDDLNKFNLSEMEKITPLNDEQMNHFYNVSHIFISTTWNEGFGLPPLEAMSAGCACVICDNGGTREFAEDEYNCLNYTAHDSRMLAEKIDRLIEDVTLRNKLANAAEKTSHRFSNEEFCNNFLKIISQDGWKG